MMIEWEIHPPCQEISRDPRDVPRAKPEGNHEGRGGGSPDNSRVLVKYGHSIHHQSVLRECIGKDWQCIQSFPVNDERMNLWNILKCEDRVSARRRRNFNSACHVNWNAVPGRLMTDWLDRLQMILNNECCFFLFMCMCMILLIWQLKIEKS